MEFATTAQKNCYEKIAPWLKELFGELAVAHDDAPIFGVTIGSAIANVIVMPWSQDDATITVVSNVVSDVELTPDLMQYLLNQNVNMRFGGFGADNNGNIFFQHTIVGSTCDKEELKASVIAVAMTADQYDDEIVARWGGRRALDVLRDLKEMIGSLDVH
ncbi:MAG: YbjN domain-containing protein [Acidobacteria bacterium]|jgi:hypothetical protein|nr:MAG: YbjN domain-containing protein [Acidobacteriota bacterium]GIU80956.1 MAG: hypothetical protein KatS3mg006_0020 [Pyrinomonadaceae bacterium]